MACFVLRLSRSRAGYRELGGRTAVVRGHNLKGEARRSPGHRRTTKQTTFLVERRDDSRVVVARRLVREALTDLDLDVLIYPCPKGGDRYRPLVERLGGKQLFPYLMDPNTGVDLYESADIIDYLYREYGGRPAPAAWRLRTLRTASSFAAKPPNTTECTAPRRAHPR